MNKWPLEDDLLLPLLIETLPEFPLVATPLRI